MIDLDELGDWLAERMDNPPDALSAMGILIADLLSTSRNPDRARRILISHIEKHMKAIRDGEAKRMFETIEEKRTH